MQSFLKYFLFTILSISSTTIAEENYTMLFLVTGCGRSGTGYTASFFKECGLNVGHEEFAKDGIVSWPMAVNSLTPWGIIINEKFKHTFHQVRNPLDVMTSWYVNMPTLDNDSWKIVRNHVPEITKEDSLIIHCAKYWYYWNLKVEQIADFRFKIEEFESYIDAFEKILGRKLNKNVLKKISKKNNSWKETSDKKITWKFLEDNIPSDLYLNLTNMARRYGYPIKD